MQLWLTDPKTKCPSVTLTAFVYGFAVCTLKLLLSGITVHGIQMAPFNGVDFAASVGALGAVYTLRKNTSIQPGGPQDNKE